MRARAACPQRCSHPGEKSFGSGAGTVVVVVVTEGGSGTVASLLTTTSRGALLRFAAPDASALGSVTRNRASGINIAATTTTTLFVEPLSSRTPASDS